MKKLLTFGTLCIVAGIFFSSCSSNISIVKRHYRSGYYVNHSKKSPAVDYTSATPRKKSTLTTIPAPELTGIQEQYVTTENGVNYTLADIPASKKISFTYTHAAVKPLLEQPVVVTKTAATKVENKIASYEGSARYDHGDDRGLSLLWIIIIVVLIIWLIGILAGDFGLGGLINLLLLIAIILLILWLLRVV